MPIGAELTNWPEVKLVLPESVSGPPLLGSLVAGLAPALVLALGRVGGSGSLALSLVGSENL